MGAYGNQRSNTAPGDQADPWVDNQVVTSTRVNSHLNNCSMRADGEEMVTGDVHGHVIFQQGYVKIRNWPYQITFGTPFTRAPGLMLHYRTQGNERTTDAKTGRLRVAGDASSGITNPCQQATDDGVVNASGISRKGFILSVSVTGDNPSPAATVYWQAIGI